MVNDNNDAVGCAMIRHQEQDPDDDLLYNYSYLVCNYAYTNMLGEPVYKMGETASECVRESEEFKGLCAPGDSDTNSSTNTAYIQQNLVVMVCVYIIATAFANN